MSLCGVPPAWQGECQSPRGCTETLSSQKERHSETVPELREGTVSPSMATQLRQETDGMAQEGQPSENGSENRGRTGLAPSPSAMFDFRFQQEKKLLPEKQQLHANLCQPAPGAGRALLSHPSRPDLNPCTPSLPCSFTSSSRGFAPGRGTPSAQALPQPCSTSMGTCPAPQGCCCPIPAPATLTLTALPSKALAAEPQGQGKGDGERQELRGQSQHEQLQSPG